MNLETARNEIMNPSRVSAQEIFIEAVAIVAVAAVTLLLIH
ncbi:MAG: hypothetical protein WBP44_08100 [Gammaproteobacteria bacterium]|jgi:hypothetical protein